MKSLSLLRPLAAAALALTTLALPQSAQAASLNICDVTSCGAAAGNILFGVGQFDNTGFYVDGSQVAPADENGYSASVAESASRVSFTGSWVDLGLSTIGSRTVFFTNSANQIVDVLSYSYSTDGSNGTVSGFVIADGGAVLPGSALTGLTPDASIAAGATYAFDNAFISAGFDSALGAPGPTPETGAGSVAALLLLSLGARARRA